MARFEYRGVVVTTSDEVAGLLSSDFKPDEQKPAPKKAAAKSDSK